MECENRSEVVECKSVVEFGGEVKIVSGFENIIPSYMVLNNSLDGSNDVGKEKMEDEKTTVFVQEECEKDVTDGLNVANENHEGVLEIKRCSRGRKKKVMESSDCVKDRSPKKVKDGKDEVEVTGRLLRSRTKTISGSATVDESRLNESVVGFKRKMETECFDHSEFQKEVDKSSQVARRPQKKQKRRGRPPKIQVEAGFGKKIKDECFDQNEIKKEVNERSQLLGRPQKKQKGRGRPPKAQSETGLIKKEDECLDPIDLQKEGNESNQLTGRQQKKIQVKEHKDTVIKKLKGRGRPPKVQAGNLATNTKKPNNNLLKANDVKEGLMIEHVPNQDQESDIAGDNKQVNISEESNDHKTVEETVKGESTAQLNDILSAGERQKKRQLVRDKIANMIMKASWTIEYRPRHGRQYLDAVYVDLKGGTHWSITKAYFSLKKKIETGNADDREISAYFPIPVEEMNVLFKSFSKIRSDKDKKKGKKSKNICKAEIVISGDASSYKILNKKGKGGKTRKGVFKSAVNLANKSSNVKVKKDKFRHEHGVISESAVQRRSKVSQKGRQSRKPCLVARSSNKGADQDDDTCTLYNGKRNILSWMIDSGVIKLGSKLTCKDGRKRNRLLEGQVTSDGIHCSCCNETLDISNFVSHGGGNLDQELKNIYYQSGPSLFTCLLESWNKEVKLTNIRFNHVDVKGDDPNDDTCNICGDGGDLICCDGCPSTFHQSCLDFQNFPSGDWHCIYCCCKFCGLVACGSGASQHAPTSEMLKCCLCEEKFHHSCLQEENVIDVGSSSLSFCGSKCQELHEQLQEYIGVKFELKEGYSWTLLKRYDLSQDLDDPVKVHCNSKLAVAFSVMDECFVPIMDERSGINRIHNVVYNCGSNFRRLDYSGFFTAILEKGGELISAASIRIHGNLLAEMPFIGTRNMYRRQGMCRRLLDAIEAALFSLGVDELVIPAIPELYNTWTNVFGFKPLEESLRQAMKGMSLIVFPGTDMLRKPLLKNQFADKNLSSVAVSGDKAVDCITVENENNTIFNEQTLATHLESGTPTTTLKTSEIHLSPSDDEHKSVGLVDDDVTGVKMSHLTSSAVPKNSFDLNLQPAATDIDIQSFDEKTISTDPQVCKNTFDLSDSIVQVDNTTTQPLVLV
ncbi:hypothetical protein M8C21_004153 [Ambrosia artemisiifolia]|uniref:Uncharacterized protein n=1 Tax=Ambrosia artemisiifolia TaxID=4212 RepID=A0AAD5GPV4_AMBAR|nr:hypothetical protein M8C21_004153 [Ambrosia artemisiifolia]